MLAELRVSNCVSNSCVRFRDSWYAFLSSSSFLRISKASRGGEAWDEDDILGSSGDPGPLCSCRNVVL